MEHPYVFFLVHMIRNQYVNNVNWENIKVGFNHFTLYLCDISPYMEVNRIIDIFQISIYQHV